MLLNPKQIAFYTGGRYIIEPIDASEIIDDLTWDSRDVVPGCLFVALPGEKADGHAYVEQAIKAGARCVLVNQAPSASACVLARELGVGIIEVPNTYHAVTDLACEWRNHIKGRVIAVTGSCGKTTTKNLLRDVASKKFSVVATKGNQNNELGAPKTLLSANPDTQVIVIEMGMDALGDIQKLCAMARPDWGVITNIGDSHMEILGSKENIARAKAELFEALPMGIGKAFVNADDPFSEFVLEVSRVKARDVECVFYDAAKGLEGADGTADQASDLLDVLEEDQGLVSELCAQSGKEVWAENAVLDAESRPLFTLCAKGFVDDGPDTPTLFDMEPDTERAECHMSLRGMHNVADACAAAAVGLALGVDIADIADALSQSVPEAGRMETLVGRDGYIVINDAYNASPDSMRASLAMFSAMDIPGRRYAVLGDMGELGSIEVDCHKGIGRLAATLPIDGLICVGPLSRNIAESALEAGMDPQAVTCAEGVGDALGALEGILTSDDAVLVKASHFMQLNRVVEGLVR